MERKDRRNKWGIKKGESKMNKRENHKIGEILIKISLAVLPLTLAMMFALDGWFMSGLYFTLSAFMIGITGIYIIKTKRFVTQSKSYANRSKK